MAHQFKLAPLGQIDLNGFPVNTTRERGRRALVGSAKKFVDTIQNANGMRDVAFAPTKGEGHAALSGGARIVAHALYELYLRAPEVKLSSRERRDHRDDLVGHLQEQAVQWALDTFEEIFLGTSQLALSDYDLGTRRGPISPTAYNIGRDYFAASMQEVHEASKAKRDERAAKERLEQYRSGGGRRESATLSAEQMELLASAV